MTLDNLLEFGVAINFFGNYKAESARVSDWADGFASRMTDIAALVTTGGIGAALTMFTNGVMNAGMQMEGHFAGLKSILGTQEKVLEALAWSQKKGLETPFTTTEVLRALTTLTTSGFAATKELREDAFNTFSDLASAFPDRVGDISNAATMVAKATMGNWEHLADNIGIRAGNIRQISQQILSQKLDTSGLNATMKDLDKHFTMIEKGTKGTTEYKKALIDILGTVFKGSNAERFNTVSGAMSNLTDIMERFYQKVAGFSQVEGDFFNRIKNTIQKSVYGKMEEFYTVTRNGVTENTNALQALDRIASRIGNTLASLWGSVDQFAGGITAQLVEYIKRVDAFFDDYQNNVAPFVLFLYLVKMQVQDFFRGLIDGFKATFGFYWKFAGFIVDVYVKFFNLFGGENKSRVYAIGAAIGHLVGAMLGLKIVTTLLSPLRTLFSLFQSGFSFVRNAMTWFGTATAEGGVVARGLTFLRGGFSALIPVIRGVGAALVANPVGAIIAIVVGYFYLLWKYWDDIKGFIDTMPGWVNAVLAIFLPAYGIPLLLIKHWDKFKEGFLNIWEGIKGFLSGAWTYIRLGFTMAADYVSSKWEKVKRGFTQFADALKKIFAPISFVFEGIGKAIDKWLIAPLREAWEMITGMWDKLGNTMKWLWEEGTSWFKEAGQNFEKGAKEAEDRYNIKKSGREQNDTGFQNLSKDNGLEGSMMPVGNKLGSQETFKTISTPSKPENTGGTSTDNSIGYNIQSLNLNIKAQQGFNVDDFKNELARELRTSVG